MDTCLGNISVPAIRGSCSQVQYIILNHCRPNIFVHVIINYQKGAMNGGCISFKHEVCDLQYLIHIAGFVVSGINFHETCSQLAAYLNVFFYICRNHGLLLATPKCELAIGRDQLLWSMSCYLFICHKYKLIQQLVWFVSLLHFCSMLVVLVL